MSQAAILEKAGRVLPRPSGAPLGGFLSLAVPIRAFQLRSEYLYTRTPWPALFHGRMDPFFPFSNNYGAAARPIRIILFDRSLADGKRASVVAIDGKPASVTDFARTLSFHSSCK